MADERRWVYSPQTAIQVPNGTLPAMAAARLRDAEEYAAAARKDADRARMRATDAEQIAELADEAVLYWVNAVHAARRFDPPTEGEVDPA